MLWRRLCCRWRSDLQGCPFDSEEHSAEYNVMERRYRVPIDESGKAARVEKRGLMECRLIGTCRLDTELKQGFSRELHFRSQG